MKLNDFLGLNSMQTLCYEPLVWDPIKHQLVGKYKVYDKWYDCFVFLSDRTANEFMNANPQWGVIGTLGFIHYAPEIRHASEYRVYVAHKDDEGYIKNKEKEKDFSLYSSTHF